MAREKVILELQEEYAQRREQNLAAYDERVNAVCTRCQGAARAA